MGAQMIHAVKELIFTSADDSILITLFDGKLIEVFGDGVVQQSTTLDTGERAIVESSI